MKMKELLSGPEKWTKNTYARNQHGDSVGYQSNDADCFCLVGAYCRCYPTNFALYNKLENTIQANYPKFGKNISGFNDDPNTTFEDIKKVLELADI